MYALGIFRRNMAFNFLSAAKLWRGAALGAAYSCVLLLFTYAFITV